jgi:hypothetical protein
MKRLTLLFLLLMLAGITNNLKGQTFFKDSTVYLGYNGGVVATNPGDPPYMISPTKEMVLFDSVTSEGEFYTVKKYYFDCRHIKDSFVYNLNVKNNKVYFKGLIKIIKESGKIDSIFVEDFLVYDFNLDIGDTFCNNFSINGYYIFPPMIMIGKKTEKLNDGKFYETFIYKFRNQAINEDTDTLYITKGLGSNRGLLFFLFNFEDAQFKSLISICNSGENIYYKPFERYEDPLNNSYCNKDSICKLFKAISIPESKHTLLNIYPNPATQTIYISGFENSKYFIYNQLGDIVLEGILSDKINIESLAEGVYILKLVDETGVYSGKFLKH